MLHLGEVEAVRRGQRQDDVVLGRRRLQLEIELPAKALAQRQAPGAVEPAAIGRMDDQLHPADRIEKALEDDCVLGRQHPEGGMPGGEILGELARRRLADADILDQPAQRLIIAPTPTLPRLRRRESRRAPVGPPPLLAGEGWGGGCRR